MISEVDEEIDESPGQCEEEQLSFVEVCSYEAEVALGEVDKNRWYSFGDAQSHRFQRLRHWSE